MVMFWDGRVLRRCERKDDILSFLQLSLRIVLIHVSLVKKKKISRLQKRWEETIRKINKTQLWQEPAKTQRLEEILSELDKLLMN